MGNDDLFFVFRGRRDPEAAILNASFAFEALP